METIEEKSLNKTPQEIEEMYEILVQSIRNYISRILADNKATEENPFECNVELDYNAVGLSSLEMPHVISLFEDKEGILWCNTDWSDSPVDFSELYLENQMTVVKWIL